MIVEHAKTLDTLLRSVNFKNPSWDAFIFFAWVGLSIVYSFAAGRGRIVSMLVSVYMAELLVTQAPFLAVAVQDQTHAALFMARLVTFLGLFLFLFMVNSKYVFRSSVDSYRVSSWFFSLIFSFLQVGFLISVILSFLPEATKQNFAPLVQYIFLSPNAGFIWLVIPIVYLAVVGRMVGDVED